MDGTSAAPRVLRYQLLKEITKDFSEDTKVGEGSYGDVYKGQLTNGEMIAVKMLRYMSGLNDKQFKTEYHNLASLQHKNIVRLVGYCHETYGEFKLYEGKEIFVETIKRALCFEYMQNGSLDRYLTEESCGHDWRTRYAIIKGICQGLKYLHEELDSPMWHLDLKPGNILLDENMVPKIADFGLSKLFAGEQTLTTKSGMGTIGYRPPEYIDTDKVSIKFDIFSLGVVIIKIMTGPKGYFRSGEMSSEEFIELVHANWTNKLQAASVYTLEPYLKQVKRCIQIALSCVEIDRCKRPSIGVIIDELNEMETAIQLLGASVNYTGTSMYKVINFSSRQVEEEYPSSGTLIEPAGTGIVKLVIRSTEKAPLLEHNKKVLLELTVGDYTGERPGLDLVVVVVVSGRMAKRELGQLKTAMQFVVQKLGTEDRLSVISISTSGGAGAGKLKHKHCSLRWITEASRRWFQQLIGDLRAEGETNVAVITEGLRFGLKVLASRKESGGGRLGSIMLMSDSQQSRTAPRPPFWAIDGALGNVPVHTFGLGPDSGPMVLSAIAAKSMGGTFSYVQDTSCLTMAFSQCLAGLLTVEVQDLELTVATVGHESTIVKVAAGNYPQVATKDDGSGGDGSVTVSFGVLYSREVRTIIVSTILPAMESERSRGVELLKVTYSYTTKNSFPRSLRYEAPPEKLTVWRTGSISSREEETPPELQTEEARLHMAKMIKEARRQADRKEMVPSKLKLEKAQSMVKHSDNTLLWTELQELLQLSKTLKAHEDHGRSYALSLESSHHRQRFAARGHMEIMRLFATPRMDKYLEQAKMFHQDPTMQLPSVDDDDHVLKDEEVVAPASNPTIDDVSSHREDGGDAQSAEIL